MYSATIFKNGEFVEDLTAESGMMGEDQANLEKVKDLAKEWMREHPVAGFNKVRTRDVAQFEEVMFDVENGKAVAGTIDEGAELGVKDFTVRSNGVIVYDRSHDDLPSDRAIQSVMEDYNIHP